MTEPIAEVGYLAGVCGDYGGDWIKLTAALDGSLKIVLGGPTGEMPVFQLAPGRMTVAQHQYDGETWRKSNLLLGYNATWDEDLSGSGGATRYNKTSIEVLENELWILEVVSCRDVDKVTTWNLIYITKDSGTVIDLARAVPLIANEPLIWTGQAVLAKGDTVTVWMEGTDSGDAIYAGLSGYKMKLDM